MTQNAQETKGPWFLKRGAAWVGAQFRRRSRETDPTVFTPDTLHPAAEAAPSAPAGPAAPLVDDQVLMDKIKNCTEALKRACVATEPDFLNLGNQLQLIQAESDELTQTVVEVLSTDQEQTINSALKTIQTHAANAIQELNHRRDKLVGDLEGLKAIQADMASLSKQNNSFKQVAKNLKMVGLNISIESARTEEAKNTFQALAEEITHLAQTVWEVAGNVTSDTSTAQQNLNAIQLDIGIRMRHLEELIASAETAVKNALVEVQGLMQLTMQVLDGIGVKAKEISEQVGHLVVGIQIHDNISQRVSHIDLSIEEAVDLIKTSTGIELPLPAMQAVYGKVYGINRLQMAQMKTIGDDVTEVYHQTNGALDRLRAAVKAVAQPEGFDLSASGSMCRFDTTGSSHPVAVLRRALEQLIHLFDEGLDDLQRLAAAREETAQTIARMSAHIDKVRDINFDIRLKALNAVIKSTRLGESGKAIEAIVNEMKELAEQSNTTIQSVTSTIEDIASASNTMDQSTDEDTREAGMAGKLLREGIDEFSEACITFKDQSWEALERGRRIEEKIIQVRRETVFFDRLLAVLQKQNGELERVETLLHPFAEAAADDWMEEEKSIVARYTMQRELDAHERIRNGKAKPAATARPETVQEVDAGGFDDNVELF